MAGEPEATMLAFLLNSHAARADLRARDFLLETLRDAVGATQTQGMLAQSPPWVDIGDAGQSTPMEIEQYVVHPEYAQILAAKVTGLEELLYPEEILEQNPLVGVFLPSGCLGQSEWNALKAARASRRSSAVQTAVRSGFLSTEFDVLESAFLGFKALCLHACLLDHYELQYLVEVGRDCQLTVIPVARDETSLQTVLQTDASYVGIWGYDCQTFRPAWPLVQRLSPRIPSNCKRVLLCGQYGPVEREMARRNGFHMVIHGQRP